MFFISLSWSTFTSVVTKSKWSSPTGIVILLIFSYSAMAYLPLPIFGLKEFLRPHLAKAWRFDFFVSSAESKFVIPLRCHPYFISPVSSHMPAKRICGLIRPKILSIKYSNLLILSQLSSKLISNLFWLSRYVDILNCQFPSLKLY